MSSPRILLIAGYFDWFSGYQETVLARSLARLSHLEILASDRAAPIFTNAHLESIGQPRLYPEGTTVEQGVEVHRVKVRERRGMVWAPEARTIVQRGDYDLIVQVMPGQILPIAASLARTRSKRVALYGDNSAMWAGLSPLLRRGKWAVFSLTKGAAYRFVNRRSEIVYGYTPETLDRLARFSARAMKLLPLAYDSDDFRYDPYVRATERAARGYLPHHRVVVFAGKFTPVKRLDLLIDGFSKAYSDDPDLRLLVIGDSGSAYGDEMRARAHAVGLSEDVAAFTGFMDRVRLARAFNAADIGVWPKQPAITIQQAMGTGLVTAIPNNSWVSHLVERDFTGAYLPDAATADAIADGLVDSRKLVSATDRKWRAEFNRRFSGDVIAEQILRDVGLA